MGIIDHDFTTLNDESDNIMQKKKLKIFLKSHKKTLVIIALIVFFILIYIIKSKMGINIIPGKHLIFFKEGF